MYAYVDIKTLLGTSVLNVTGTAHDTRVRQIIESASQEVDRFANHRFHPTVGTYYFSGQGGGQLLTPDLISVVSLKEDDNGDGSFDTTWATTDYVLAPYNSNPTSQEGRPYNWIEVSKKSNGTQDEFWAGQRNYEIVGTWGYVAATLTIGLVVSSSLSATATSFPLSGSASGTIEAGMTMLVGTEQIYVLSSSATAATVRRGQNGAAAAVIASGSAIAIYQYPLPVVEAVMMHAGRLYKRGQAAYASQAGAPDGGFTVFNGGMDQDVRQMLNQYRRPALGV